MCIDVRKKKIKGLVAEIILHHKILFYRKDKNFVKNNRQMYVIRIHIRIKLFLKLHEIFLIK